MYSETLLESLIQGIYEAAVNAAGWTTFLISLATALGSRDPTLYLVDTSGKEGALAFSVGLDEKTMQSYASYYHQRNVWIRGARPLLKPGVVRSSNMMCSRREFLRSEWYAGFCKPLGWTQGLGVTLFQKGTITSNLGLFAGNQRAPYDESDFSLVRALLPHLQRGIRMYLQLSTSRARGQAFEAVLNSLPTPVILVSAEGRIVFVNAAAERHIRAADGLVVEAGELRALRSDDTKSLRMLIGGAAKTSGGKGRGSGGVVRISRPFGRDPLEVLVSPLPRQHDDWMMSQPPVAAVFVTDRERAVMSEESTLIRLHGLTPRETKIAAALARGLTGKEICRELDISYNTLKTHLKRIYSKTHTRRQSDLVRFLAAATHVPGPDEAGGRA